MKKSRLILVMLMNLYIVLLTWMISFDFYLGEQKSILLSCVLLVVFTVIPICIVLLSWESKWVICKDENKGYFTWIGLLIIMFWAFVRVLQDQTNIVWLEVCGFLYLFVILLLQFNNIRKEKEINVSPDMSVLEYQRAIYVMNGIQLIIIIVYWDFAKSYLCVFACLLISFICSGGTIGIMLFFSKIVDQLRKKYIFFAAVAYICSMLVMGGYTLYEIKQRSVTIYFVRENYLNSFEHLIANCIVILLQMPFWKFATKYLSEETKSGK